MINVKKHWEFLNILVVRKNQKPRLKRLNGVFKCFDIMSCRERGIRTPGPVTVNGFQDRRNRPLCHLSKSFRRMRNVVQM